MPLRSWLRMALPATATIQVQSSVHRRPRASNAATAIPRSTTATVEPKAVTMRKKVVRCGVAWACRYSSTVRSKPTRGSPVRRSSTTPSKSHRHPAAASSPTVRCSPRYCPGVRRLRNHLRACADRSWSSGRTPCPAVATPALPDEPPHDDDHLREGHPEVDHPTHLLRAPHELLVGVVPRASPFHHPALRYPERRGLALLGDLGDEPSLL